MSRLVPPYIDVVVVSSGGVGTSLLLRFLSNYIRTNSPYDFDGLKHLPAPPICLSSKTRFLFLYGSPIDAAASLFGRAYHHHQSKKLLMGKDIRPIPLSMALDEYVNIGEDRFRFQDQFENWYNAQLPNDIMFLRYETMWDHIPELLEFCRIPAGGAAAFPERRSRSRNKAQLADSLVDGLEQLYGDFEKTLGKMADIEVRLAAQPGSQRLVITPAFWQAVWNEIIFNTLRLLRFVKRRLKLDFLQGLVRRQ